MTDYQIVGTNRTIQPSPDSQQLKIREQFLLRIYTGNRLLYLITQNGFSFKEISSQFFLNDCLLIDLFTGKRTIDIIQLWELSKLFDFSLSDFFDGFKEFKTSTLAAARYKLDILTNETLRDFFLYDRSPELKENVKKKKYIRDEYLYNFFKFPAPHDGILDSKPQKSAIERRKDLELKHDTK